MRGLVVDVPGLGRCVLKQLPDPPTVWKIVSEQTCDLQGLVVTYVDDLLCIGKASAVKAIMGTTAATWKCKAPWFLSDSGSLRFLGMDVMKSSFGDFLLHQTSYTQELLKQHDLDRAKGTNIIGAIQESIHTGRGDLGESESQELIKNSVSRQSVLCCGFLHRHVQTLCLQFPVARPLLRLSL